MSRYKDRSSSACYYCRKQKVKCSGGHPCSKCLASQKECFFPSKDAVLTVPESYLRKLENEIAQLRQSLSSAASESTTSAKDRDVVLQDKNAAAANASDRLLDDSTTEHFVGKLKSVYCGQIFASSPEYLIKMPNTSCSGNAKESDEQVTGPSYTYVPLNHDSAESRMYIKLPSHSYALYQLGQFESFIGADYHWYRKRRFREKMEKAYSTSQAHAVDRTWLCCFSVVLALGESYNDSTSPKILLSENIGISHDVQNNDQESQAAAPPGIELFEQALLLLKLSFEEPTIELVEALNLISFYSYSLNRRKTAYAYAGMALRLATTLGLPGLSPSTLDPAEFEHRKRVWWTVVCMELMTCTELSLKPACGFGDNTSLAFPECTHLTAEDMAEFSDPMYLTAQVKLCRIKSRVVETACELRSGSLEEAHGLITPCLQSLSQWREEFRSVSLSFLEAGQFSSATLAHPSMRTLASLIMRYNQCYILLLRPLLLKELYSLVQEGNESTLATNDELNKLNDECLRAATDNASIQAALSKCHRIAKFGFWESLHIFSSLLILLISSFVMENCSGSFSIPIERELYRNVREILGEMARHGNRASRDHERMIQEIENLFPTGSANIASGDKIEDIIGWTDYLDFGNMGSDLMGNYGSLQR
ncbi:hypothetical protein QQS21_006454 [Conoideocrella luteorostrata]|uniref:Zn(2)-C6 fungal-type domain-containing protein n=1 Tax=Conoideocrella luteorostrata TaxID=1105319 RepID=A0AAJ0CMP0_9HYPO|nr:hypothetical protein QQS21_006454 [Conoideocrella luteorostrata]